MPKGSYPPEDDSLSVAGRIFCYPKKSNRFFFITNPDTFPFQAPLRSFCFFFRRTRVPSLPDFVFLFLNSTLSFRPLLLDTIHIDRRVPPGRVLFSILTFLSGGIAVLDSEQFPFVLFVAFEF